MTPFEIMHNLLDLCSFYYPLTNYSSISFTLHHISSPFIRLYHCYYAEDDL